jgi:hypothetical protein
MYKKLLYKLIIEPKVLITRRLNQLEQKLRSIDVYLKKEVIFRIDSTPFAPWDFFWY